MTMTTESLGPVSSTRIFRIPDSTLGLCSTNKRKCSERQVHKVGYQHHNKRRYSSAYILFDMDDGDEVHQVDVDH